MRKKFINFLFKLKSIIKSRLIIPILIILFIIIFFVYLIYGLFFGPAIGFNNDILLNNLDDYNSVANFFCSEFNKSDAKELSHYINDNDNEDIKISHISDNYSYDLNIDSNILKSLNIVVNSYKIKYWGLMWINVSENFVSFCNESGYCSLIYSKNNIAPDFISKPSNKDKRLYISKICDNWYYACTRR